MNVEKEIKVIKKRNKKVEGDKAWETSWTRRILLAALTYIVIVIFFYIARLPQPWVNSLVPTAVFVISTLTLGVIKKVWLRYYKG